MYLVLHVRRRIQGRSYHADVRRVHLRPPGCLWSGVRVLCTWCVCLYVYIVCMCLCVCLGASDPVLAGFACHACMHGMHVCMHTCMLCMYACIHIHCVHASIHMYVCMYTVYVCVRLGACQIGLFCLSNRSLLPVKQVSFAYQIGLFYLSNRPILVSLAQRIHDMITHRQRKRWKRH